jgi:NADH dehydrogenase
MVLYISNKDGVLQLDEFLSICEKLRTRFPLTEEHLINLKKMFQTYDLDKNDSLDMNEMEVMLNDIDKKLTHLPAVSFFFLNSCTFECIF